MDYALTVESVTKDYGKFRALDGISLHVPRGSVYGLVGRNGAGKTTLIRIICGLQKPTSGSYALFGADSSSKEINKARRRMGAVVETPSIYLDMTAEENLRQQFMILGNPDYSSVKKLLALVGLENTGKKKAKNFSLGMKQRLGIAVALAGNPDFIVLDEPVNGLDPQGIIEIRELILKLNREMGITILISSHILDELSRLATHYCFIDKGCAVKEISASELGESARKSVVVETDLPNALVRYLEEKGMEYRIDENGKAQIYTAINITSLVTDLSNESCHVLSIKEKNESLESYFINLVGGDD